MNFSNGLTLLFIALKLTGHIAWSWFWVVLPFFLALPLYALQRERLERQKAKAQPSPV